MRAIAGCGDPGESLKSMAPAGVLRKMCETTMETNCQRMRMPERTSAALHRAWIATAVAVMMVATVPAQAQKKGKPFPAYAGQPKDCYQLLKNKLPQVQSGDSPVCQSVIKNFNRFCDRPVQYDQRLLHAESTDLQEPAWSDVPVTENLDLVKEAYVAVNYPKYRESLWANEQERVTRLAHAAKLKLFSASVDLNLGLGRQDIYRLTGYYDIPVPAGYQQPRLMITTAVAPRTSSALVPASFDLAADLWQFQQAWYLVHFDPIERRFVVKELLRPGRGEAAPIETQTRCTIMHAEDNPS